VSTESPAPTAPATPPKPARSPVEKLIVRTLLIVGIGLIAFEARAMYGYKWTLEYLVSANEVEESVGQKPEEGDAQLQDFTPTLDKLKSEPYGPLALVMGPSFGEKKFKKPTTVMGPDGKPLVLKDKDGKVVKLDSERDYNLPMRWYSIRDLYEEKPAYTITVKLSRPVRVEGEQAQEGDEGGHEIIGFFTDQDPADAIKPGKFIPQSKAAEMLSGGPRPPAKGKTQGKGKGRRPGKGAGKSHDHADNGKADEVEVKQEEPAKSEEPTKSEESTKAEKPKEEAKPAEKAEESGEKKAGESAEKKAEEPPKEENGGAGAQ